MDTTTAIVIIVFLIILGIFFISQGNSGGNENTGTGYATFSNQYAGGACGR